MVGEASSNSVNLPADDDDYDLVMAILQLYRAGHVSF